MNPLAYLRIGGVILVLLLFVAAYVKGRHDVQEHFDSYKAMVKAIGEAQEERTRVRIAADKGRKAKADEETKRNRAALVSERKRLSELVADFHIMPPAGPAAASPERTCFDSAELAAALQRFVADTSGLAFEGNQAVIDLNTAKRWGQSR